MKHFVPLVVSVLSILFFFGGIPCVFAQPSLAEVDSVTDLTVKLDGNDEQVTVIRDGMSPNVWYYLPVRPRLAMQKNPDTGELRPVFQLLKYQGKETGDMSKLTEGAILQFAFNLALPPDCLDELRQKMAAKGHGSPSSIQLKALPMQAGALSIYGPDGKSLGEVPETPSIAPAFANQEIPVQMKLNKLGADVYEALCNGTTGIPLVVKFDYNGITQRLGFKAIVNWTQCYTHLSMDKKLQAEAVIKAVGVGVNVSQSHAIDAMVQKKDIQVESLLGEGFTKEDQDKMLSSVLDKIIQECMDVKPPADIPPAVATTSGEGGLGGKVLMGFAMKAQVGVKKGVTTFNYSQRQIMKRSTVVGGFIGIGKYPAKMREGLITTLNPGGWENAFLDLPDVGNAKDLGVSQISLCVSVVDAQGKPVSKAPPQQIVNWTAKTEEWMHGKDPQTAICLPMMGMYSLYKHSIRTFFYKLDTTISYQSGKKTFTNKFTEKIPIFNGDVPITTPTSLVEPISIGHSLTFAPNSDLVRATVRLETLIGGKKQDVTFTLMEGGQPINYFAEKGETSIKATVTFQKKDGKKKETVIPDLRVYGMDPFFGDWDWQS